MGQEIMATGNKSRQDSGDEGDPEPTSPTSPLAQFPPLPPASSRSRAPEFYGFVAWAVTCLLFVLYFLWAILPDEWIVWLGVSWYPNRCVLFP
jgi:phosphatidylinositol N-acetylglucosaminyltransferase subunit P